MILFPLLLTDMLGKVDITCTVEDGGPSGQAGALRFAISKTLYSIVDPIVRAKMILAGLMQRDIRRKERKKPGRDGARRRYTWLKR